MGKLGLGYDGGMATLTRFEHPLRWFLSLAGLTLLLGLGARHAAQGPDLEMRFSWDRQRLHLDLGQGRVLDLPRHLAPGTDLALGFWSPPERMTPSRQQLLAELSPDEHGVVRLGRLDAQGDTRWVLRAPEDLTLWVGSPGLNDALGFMVRPRSNDWGWYQRQKGQAGALQDYQALGPMAPLAWRLAAAEALAWAAAAAALLLLVSVLAWLLGRFGANGRSWRPSTRGGPLALMALSLLLAGWSLRWGGEGLPHVSDEISALFQTRILSHGHTVAPSPPQPEAFRMDHVLADERGWRSKYPLLWPSLLAPFNSAGYAWLAGPFYGAMAVLALFIFARAASGRAEALAAAGLLACSPQALWLAGSYFNHAASLLASVLLLFGGWSAMQGRPGAWSIAALGGAALAVMRPYSAALLSLALSLWALLPRGSRGAALKGLGLLAAAQVLALGLSNTLSTGSPWLSPYLAYDPMDRPGFGPLLGSLPSWGSLGHDAMKGLANTALYLSDLRQRALGWPGSLGGGLLVLGLLFRRGWQRLDTLLLLSFGALVVGHYFYWCGHLLTFGTFYWYEGLACLLWLALRGAGRLATALQEKGLAQARQALALIMVLGCVAGLLQVLPRQAWALRGYAGVDGRLAQVLAPQGPAMRGLVFVQDRSVLDYHAAFALQQPFQDGRFVLARSRGEAADKALAALYPTRRPLYWDGKRLSPLGGVK